MTTPANPATDSWLTQLAARVDDPAAEGTAAWLTTARAAALATFRKTGFPTHQDEAWRFTNVEPIARSSYEAPIRLQTGPGATRALGRAAAGLADGPRLVFLNGRPSPELSSVEGLPEGARLTSLRQALASDDALVKSHLGTQIDLGLHPFAALNSGLWEDGVCLHLAEGTLVKDPILIVFLSASPVGSVMTSPRLLVVAGPGARATIVESYAAMPCDSKADGQVAPGVPARQDAAQGSDYFTNTVTEIVLGQDAAVDHIKLQLESTNAFHVATIAARLSRGSRYDSRSMSAGGALVRNDLYAVLDGEGAECNLDGLFLASGSQHVDNHTTIDHASPHGTSRETYKGILTGRARGVFDGRIIVRADAQKTDSRQVNRNLLLSDSALINTKPQLEINADDVKCAHAATIGRLDEASLFYLRARGLGHDEARALLIDAFAGEVVGRIGPEPIRARLSAMVHALAIGGPMNIVEEAA